MTLQYPVSHLLKQWNSLHLRVGKSMSWYDTLNMPLCFVCGNSSIWVLWTLTPCSVSVVCVCVCCVLRVTCSSYMTKLRRPSLWKDLPFVNSSQSHSLSRPSLCPTFSQTTRCCVLRSMGVTLVRAFKQHVNTATERLRDPEVIIKKVTSFMLVAYTFVCVQAVPISFVLRLPKNGGALVLLFRSLSLSRCYSLSRSPFRSYFCLSVLGLSVLGLSVLGLSDRSLPFSDLSSPFFELS